MKKALITGITGQGDKDKNCKDSRFDLPSLLFFVSFSFSLINSKSKDLTPGVVVGISFTPPC